MTPSQRWPVWTASLLLMLMLMLARTAGAKKPSLSDKFMLQAIQAASENRVQGTFSSNSSCLWPTCAPICMSCPATKMGDCIVPVVQSCPANADCLFGTCFCNDGYCPSGGRTCVFQTCSLGAKPPVYEATGYARNFAHLGQSPPAEWKDKEEWQSFFWGNAKLPIGLALAGVFIGVLTCACTTCKLECECSWLPTKPWLLVGLCCVTIGITVLGVWQRAWVVNSSFSLAETQIARLQGNFNEAMLLSDQLTVMSGQLQEQVDGLSGSCVVPGSNLMMNVAVQKANETLAGIDAKIRLFKEVSTMMNKYISLLSSNIHFAHGMVVYLPMLPLILLVLAVGAILGAACLSMHGSDPDMAEKADDLVIMCGSPCSCVVMIVAAVMSAGYLFVGMMAGNICLNLDDNVINAVSAFNFTKLVKFPYDINPIMQGAARYYLQGSENNPMISMVQSAQGDAHSLYTVYTNDTWATDPAGVVCDGVKGLNPHLAMGNFDTSCAWLISMLRAKNMWPYYKTFAQDIMCGTMLNSMTLLIMYTILVSHVLLPLVTILADIDFRRWERFKETNPDHQYGPMAAQVYRSEVPLNDQFDAAKHW